MRCLSNSNHVETVGLKVKILFSGKQGYKRAMFWSNLRLYSATACANYFSVYALPWYTKSQSLRRKFQKKNLSRGHRTDGFY